MELLTLHPIVVGNNARTADAKRSLPGFVVAVAAAHRIIDTINVENPANFERDGFLYDSELSA
jgi:hypothetical protein